MNCSICGKPIVLSPPATERAKRYGGKPSDYTALFTEHSGCLIDKRSESAKTLMRTINQSPKAMHFLIQRDA